MNGHESNRNLTSKKISIFISIGLLVLYILPFIILQKSTYIHVHDNLDGSFLSYHLLANLGLIFTFNNDIILDNIMNGLPIYCLSSIPFVVLFYFILGPFAGYIVNDIVVHFIAFFGMYLLLKEYFLKEPEERYLVIFLSICFALIRFESGYGISVAGQPILLYAFLNLCNQKQKIVDYVVIIVYPFYELFVLTGVFIVGGLMTILMVDIVRNKKLNLRFLVWIFIFIFLCFIAEFKLFHGVLFAKSFIPHRVEWAFDDITIMSVSMEAIKLFFQTGYHSGAFGTYAIIFSFITASAMVWRTQEKLKPMLIWLPSAIIAICIFHGLYIWGAYESGIGDIIPLFKSFQVNRISYFLPLLWFLLFAISLNEIRKFTKSSWIIYGCLIFHLILVGFENIDFRHNLRQLHAEIFKAEADENYPNFKQFFAENLFFQIKDYINIPQENYRVVSIGLHPSISQYNGFYTLDSYQSIYPLRYKHEFRKIIAPELDKHAKLKKYFDGWGSRCYVFVSELKNSCYLSCSSRSNYTINKLEINSKALKEMGGKYIISAVSINNYKELNLSFEKVFEHKDSYWKIFLYRVL